MSMDREERAIVSFARKKKVQLYLLIPAVIAIILAFIANSNPGFAIGPVTHTGFVWIFLGLVILIMIYYRINWRCPACGISLGSVGSKKKCPRCGIKLQKD
jgi:hypothetical protein